ncbi:hypothetical protein [Pseudomonas fluorescens]|uniref:Uncharacterized protein n=1 Tax=Pseudomonas fluorescens TaxID=294 RepID=A0A0F4V9M8_PSEFL|nr:hypothetical protein [Pseudomonas fluorescens]KJZ65434.1 hypothetical protein VD17_12565 [Pseudomonas fluorescens]
MTIYQAGTSRQENGILVAPTPELPDGRGPNSDIIPLAAIPVGGDLTLLLDTSVWLTPNGRDQVALEFTRTQPPPNPLPSDFTRLPRVPLGAVATRPPKFSVTLPAQNLGENATPAGPTPIWVRCVLFERGLNPLSSAVTQLFIDRTAPWQAKPVQTGPNPGATPGAKSTPLVTFPNAPTPSTLIDDTWAVLPGNANGLIVDVDLTYPNFQATDRLTLYAAGTRTDPPQVAPIFDAVVPPDGEVTIPIPVLRAVTTGRVQIWFRLTDVAGNFSNYSVNYRNLRFLPLPVLGDPVVPSASDGLVDLNDVRAGVTVRVARPTDALNTDSVSLKWGDETAEDLPFNTLNELIFTIPWAKLRNEYFSKQIGTVYELPVLVKADLMRGGSSISDSQTTVNTDYSVAGTPYPVDLINPPGEFNTEFKQLIVRGQPPVVDNTLGPQDVNQTATIYIDLTPVSGAIWPDPELGDMVTVKYRGDMGEVVVVSEPLTTGNINTEIELDLPYSIVGPGGLGEQEIWWEVENPNRNNIQKAAETKLTINTVIINLDAPEFVRPPADGTVDPFIICESLTGTDHVARFRIPPNSHFVAGMDITFNWRGFRTDDYLTPAPTDTEFTETRAITTPELTAGMIFDVGPYDPVIRNVPVPPPTTPDPDDFYAGYAKIWYSTPTVPTSGVTEMTIYLLNADFLYCESEPGWAPAP